MSERNVVATSEREVRRGLGMGLSCIGEVVVNFNSVLEVVLLYLNLPILALYVTTTVKGNIQAAFPPPCQSRLYSIPMVVVPFLSPLEVHISLPGAPSTPSASQ